MRLHYLQHVPFEGLGMIADWAAARNIEVSATRLFAEEPLPHLRDFDLLVVLGGPMSVHDTGEYAWLAGEMAFISRALECGKPALGICLGAQLFAHVLGANIGRSAEREIGWYPLMLSEDLRDNPLAPLGECSTVFHWHGETFGLPDDAVLLAGTPGCANQAFYLAGSTHVLALQFHIETTPENVRALLANAEEGELSPGPFIQTPEKMLAKAEAHSAALRPALFTILDRWSGAAD